MHLSAEAVWQMNDRKLLHILESDSFLPRRKQLHFYAPSFMYYKTSQYHSSPADFPTISVTGRGCSLRCKHCGGKVLETMFPVNKPQELLELCRKLKSEGALGCLISGGCLPDGSVPFRSFVDVIGKVKRELGLTVFAHTGVIDFQTAKLLKDSGVDAALIDVIGSDETIREVYRLKVSVEDYANSLKALSDSGIDFVPHVIAGLHYGRLKGEFQALKIICTYNPSALVVIAFMPIHGTEMEVTRPPEPLDIARVIVAARLLFPQTPLALGCMRPKGKHRSRTDVLAIKAGVDAIAFPAEDAIHFAQESGYETVFSSLCCSQIFLDVKGP